MKARAAGLLLWACLPVCVTLNQVMMKLAAGQLKTQSFGMQWLEDAALSPYIWLSFCFELVNFVVWLAILKRHDLSRAFPLTSISYVALLLTGWFVFYEPMQWRQALGVMVILGGVVLLAKEEN